MRTANAISLPLALAVVFFAVVVFAADDPRGMKVVYAEKRIALVIGNSAYTAGPLPNAANDAGDMAEALGRRKFEVALLTNADKICMETAIEEFGKALQQGGIGLFYYAGHAMQIDGANYLIPVGAKINKEGDVKHQAVDVGLVLTEMESSQNRLNIVILDSCRDNPFARGFRTAASAGLARMDAPSGTLIAYATAPGKTAADGAGRNAVYTGALLNHMDTPGLELASLFKKVRSDVETATVGKQTPWESTSVKGDFFFTPIDMLDEKLNLTAEQLARMQQLLAEQKQADEKLKRMEEEKTAEIERMNGQIRDLQAKLSQSGAGDGTLDQMVAMVDKRKQYRDELDTAKRNAEEAKRQREAEMARLKAQESLNKKKAFESDNAKYDKLCIAAKEGLLSDAELAAAWKTLCANWKVTDAGVKPGKLSWDDRRGVAVAGAAGIAPAGGVWKNTLGMEFVPVSGTDVLFCKWETRVQDFEAFVKDTGYDATKGMWSAMNGSWGQHGDTWKTPGFKQGATHPVCGVSWDDAKAFCDWLTKKEHDAGILAAGQKYRLPRDWEWSAAAGLNEARNGAPGEKSMKRENIYPWGTNWPPSKGAGNYAGNEAKDSNWPGEWQTIGVYNDGYARTSPAGSFNANKYDLYDLGGNVWEWCEDFYDGQSGGRVLRGGAWDCGVSRFVLSSTRSVTGPDGRGGSLGFRCVVESSSESATEKLVEARLRLAELLDRFTEQNHYVIRQRAEIDSLAGVVNDPAVVENRLLDARRRLADLQKTLGEKHPDVIRKENVIKELEKLRIESASGVVTSVAVFHTVGPGDTALKIARKHGTTVAAIEKINPGVDWKRLKIGVKLRVK